jgi:hypothetical protein
VRPYYIFKYNENILAFADNENIGNDLFIPIIYRNYSVAVNGCAG